MLVQAAWEAGSGRTPAGSSPAVPPPPHPGCAHLRAMLPEPALLLHPVSPGPKSPAPRGGGVSHHVVPPVALHGEVWAEEQVGDGQEQGLGQGSSVLIFLFTLLGETQAAQWRLARERWPRGVGVQGTGTGSQQAGVDRGRKRKWIPAYPKSPLTRREQTDTGIREQ